MAPIDIQPTDETPGVKLDPSTGAFEFWGKSLPEDVTEFYDPLLEWLDGYAESAPAETNVTFRLSYFNTASSKMILDILMRLEQVEEDGNSKVKVNWGFQDGDEDMEEAGEEFQDIVELPFNIYAYA